MLSVASFTFLSFPFGIATAASVRVGQLCGAMQPRQARDAAAAALVLGCGTMGLLALLIWASRSYVAAIFTTDTDVTALVVRLAPVCALFQMLDGFQGVSGGILRGLGYQPVIALLGLHYLASSCTLLNDTSLVPRNGCVGSLPGLLITLLLAANAANAALKAESGGEAGRRLVHASSD